MNIIEQLDKRIEELQTQKREIQEGCSHPGHTRVSKSDTGNWSKADDSYWTSCECTLCF